MARHKDGAWNLSEAGPNGSLPHTEVHLAILMDVRDELKKLNRVFECRNFLRIPAGLTQIRRNTTKRKRVRR